MLSTAVGLALALSGCGSDGGSGGSGPGALLPTPSPTPSPAPAPSPTPDPSPTPTPTPSPGLSGWTLNAQAMYDVQPDLATCRTGTLKASVRAEMVNRINALRALHNLPAITHSDADNQQVDDSSLMMAVNQTLSHTPPTSWICYTAAGASGANTGNLIGGWGSGLAWMSEDDNLALWMNEGGTAAIGHRRWILDPFLGKVAYGRVAQAAANGLRSDASTLKVHSFASAPATPTGLPAFVAYPYGDYPGRYFRARDHLSFSVIASGTSRAANLNVRFTGASVTVSDGTSNLPITDVASDNQGYGLPNSIQWRVTGLTSNVTYTVRITGVTGAPQSSYQYTFKMLP